MRNSKPDRRQGPDLLQRSFFWLALICWGLFLVAMLTYHFARPEVEYGLLRYWNIDIRNTWDPQKLPLFLYALWGCCSVTLLGVVLNFPRNRRFEDYHIFYFTALLLITIASLITYYFRAA